MKEHVTIYLSITREDYKTIYSLARENDRALNAQIRVIIREYINSQKK